MQIRTDNHPSMYNHVIKSLFLSLYKQVSLDHVFFALPSRNFPRHKYTNLPSMQWYTRYLGMKPQVFTSNNIQRHALTYGQQKINLHQQGAEFEPKAKTALPGTADLCFIVQEGSSLQRAIEGFGKDGIEVLEGGKVVERTGAVGKIRSVYVRDPDGNLIEYGILFLCSMK